MATEVGTGYVTIYSKMSPDFDKPIQSKVKTSGQTAGNSFGGTFSVAAGNLLSSGIQKALGAVTAHMDSAIGRVDALNQFPKVMQNIGFSSEEASAAMSKMAAGIDGLPTTLDDIVGNTQRLAMSIGDLDKASDVAIALNDGFLMFGASSAEVGNAITQLNQMITAGKYDMQSWNSINQAAPGFLDTVARSMLGAEANAGQLRDALNSGKLTTDDFLGAIVNLDKNGMEGYTSFSEGVKSATGGIETSMSRIDSAITRNLASVLDLITENTDFVSVCDTVVGAINTVGEFINGTLTSAFIAVKPFVENLSAAIKELTAKMQPGLTQVINVLTTIFRGTLIVVVTAVIAIFTSVIQTITSVIDFFTNLASTVQSMMTNARGAVEYFKNMAINAFNALVSMVGGAISGLASTIGGFVSNAVGAAGEIASGIANTLSSLPGQALGWGADIVGNIASGIRNAIGSVADAAGSIASTIASFLHFSEPDVGPLSNFHTFMPDMMELMAKGIRNNVGLVRDEIDGLSEYMAGGLGGVNINSNNYGGSDVVSAINALHGDLSGIIRSATPDGITERQFGRLVRQYA